MKNWNCQTHDIERIIDAWIFSARDRAIMKRIIIDDITYDQAAEEFGLTPRGIGYVVKRNRDIILEHI